jgi:hypothetical protein
LCTGKLTDSDADIGAGHGPATTSQSIKIAVKSIKIAVQNVFRNVQCKSSFGVLEGVPPLMHDLQAGYLFPVSLLR